MSLTNFDMFSKTVWVTEKYSEPCQTFKMERFGKTVHS